MIYYCPIDKIRQKHGKTKLNRGSVVIDPHLCEITDAEFVPEFFDGS